MVLQGDRRQSDSLSDGSLLYNRNVDHNRGPTSLANPASQRYYGRLTTSLDGCFRKLESNLGSNFPESNEVQLFVVPLAVSNLEMTGCEKLLNAEELARANRFMHADVRRRFVVCRGMLRRVMATAVSLQPEQIKFHYEQWGKPRLERRSRPEVHFNVAHSDEWALIALAQSPVGVDVEVLNERINYRAIASQILTSCESQAWDQLVGSDREMATMQLWVCKEALLKAMGLGIAEGLKQVSFPLPIPEESDFAPVHIDGQLQMHLEDDGSCRTNHWIDASAWRLRMLRLIPNSFAAICMSHTISTVTIHGVSR